MSVEDRPPEFLSDGAGIAGAYRERARILRRQSMTAAHSRRPMKQRELLDAAAALDKAAEAEGTNPSPRPFAIPASHDSCCTADIAKRGPSGL